MKRRNTTSIASNPDSTVRTGEHCPQSGWWFTINAGLRSHPERKTQYITEGSLMPAVNGFPAKWFTARKWD
ncbi:hypothetical protein [Arthrobacter sp. StoSoilB5]|uniref:hypothetical protein n=1 Tax=Arthrobacter sp. StoSoilB5 TaxID=2830992 RepID=UPI001CC74E97|nr:hypothetical protein [Arthrobacter sp. StoSoilB5]BCW44686.1 hypothetical protein StoSoilB5_18700 [Arthrobacter sp. StoSoilB5]